MVESLSTKTKPELKLHNKKVMLAGRFRWGMEQPVRAVVLSEGGELAKDFDESLDLIIVGSESHGTPAAAKQAEKLNKKGAKIAIFDENDLFSFCIPDRDELIKFMKAGESERLAILFNHEYRYYWAYQQNNRLDVCSADLSGIALRSFRFDRLNTDNCDLSRAELQETHFGELKNVNLSNSHLVRCYFSNLHQCLLKAARVETCFVGQISFDACDMSSCNLNDMIFASASFKHCNLEKTKFTKCGIVQSTFDNCNLPAADMSDCDVSQSQFVGGNLKGVNFQNAHLVRAVFQNSDLSGCDFTGANLAYCDLSTARIGDATFTNCNLANADFGNADTSRARGLSESLSRASSPVCGPNIAALEKAFNAAQSVILQFSMVKADLSVSVNLSSGGYGNVRHIQLIVQNSWQNNTLRQPFWFDRQTFNTLPDAFRFLASVYQGFAPDFESIETRMSKGSSTAKEVKTLLIKGLCEVLGMSVPSDENLRKQETAKKAEQAKEKEAMIKLLRGGASGIKEFNELEARHRTKVSLRKTDFANCDLSGANLGSMDLRSANFEKSIVSQAAFDASELGEANLKEANLDGASCKRLQAPKASFACASLIGCDLDHARLNGADFSGANLQQANLSNSDVQGANLSTANLEGTIFNGARYNEKTQLPAGFQAAGMTWCGSGTDPEKLREVMESAPKEPLDFARFLERLEASVDRERLKKAVKMLKAESFQLFSDVKSDSVMGVVKSQTDPDLVYSCRLNEEGKFCCGTQNLNPCGGLRGALCKHLLVLLLGLTKAGELDANLADAWARASKLQQPKMEKDIMSETFLRYKGAEAGEIDWRPTETIPEDYYAY